MSTNAQYPLRSASPAADPNASPTVRGESGPPQHKRVYQACIPCRRRKVKCDLGSVDNPGDPPCVRCRRESKECFFSATRRKRKLEDGGEGSLDGYELNDDYVVRNGRKMVQSSPGRQSSMSAPARSVAGYADAPLPAPPLTPGGSIGRTQPLRRPDASLETGQGRQSDESNTHMENFEAQEVMRREVYGPHDALDLLYQAATDSPDHKRTNSNQFSPAVAHMSQDRRPSSARNNQYPFQSNYRKPDARTGTDASIDPALSANQTERAQDPGYQEALKAWSRFRFVRAGWFSADEAIEYIDYYYTFLSPLTPISPPTFQNPSTHLTLLVEEPILTITLLTIATRYKKLVGPGGHCRSHAIHEQLWTYLRGMIERCLWGQEAFGGGLQSSGSDSLDKTSSTAPWRGLRKGSLRTLGTVESLMILTEWHPRALHFPPTEATDELMLPSYEASDAFSNDDEDVHRLAGVGGKRIEGWLEPAWRSDRMCWMLLSTAMGLSYELGVFDNIDELIAAGGEMTRPEYEDRSYQERAGRIKKLLLIYVSQLAGRLGWTNMVPENVRLGDPSFTSRKRRKSAEGKTPDTNISVATSFNYIPDLALDDQIIHLWAGISNAMKVGNEKLFKSRQHTTSIIKNGSYVGLLKEFVPLLANWKKEFLACQLPQYIGHILLIEFEYVRVYINSLSLQAVVERGANAAGNHANFAAAQPGNGGNPGAAVLSPETQNYYDKLPLAKLGGFFREDQGYVKEVVDGSRNLLSIVVTGLLPNGYLKHAPVRTYFRIISGAMFLLKTFALGASKHDVQVSLDLMDRAVDALRNCVVDDVHLGIRFADLLETLTSRLRTRFINSASKPVSTTEEPRSQTPQEPEGKRQKMDSNWQIREWNAATPSFDPNGQAATPVPPYDAPQNTNGTPGNSNNYYASTPNFPSNSNGEPNFDPLFDNSNSWGAGNEMWYLPPGAAFYSNLNEQAITQTADGVNVAGMDLLDYMAGGDFYMDGAQF